MARRKTTSDFSHSMVDLMTSLAVIMILLLVVFMKRDHEELDEAQNSGQALKERLLADLKSLGLPAESDPNDPLALFLRIRDDSLRFDVNKSQISPSGKSYLVSFIPKLMGTLAGSTYKRDVNSLLIEGHTDSDGDDENNLRLSQDRAFEVLRCSMNDAGLPGEMREYLLRIASTNGRGERDLLPENSSAGLENKAQSRRVEFRIRIRSYEQKKFKELFPEAAAKNSLQASKQQDVSQRSVANSREPEALRLSNEVP